MTTSGLTQASKIPAFFIAGGTLGLDSPSYVIRPADEELFSAVLAGNFCYVLTARQMGKSSLMVRTTQRLQKEKVKTATVDLTNIGTIGLTIDQWYTGLLDSLSRQLHVPLDVPKWWRQHQSLGQIPRFTRFLRDEILAKVPESVAIFIDEIDSTLGLSFSDDFFAAIRAIHNARATEPIYDRLTFILLGTAAPTDLMKDPRRTPFNIGKRIDLPPFKLSEEQKLENLRQGLEEEYPGEGSNIFDRVFYWTSGHPYLTQKLCLAIVEKKSEHRSGWTKPQIDAIVQRIFLSTTEKPDINIQILVDRLRKHPKSAGLLKLYQEVLEKDAVPDDEQSYLHEQLKLIGIVRAEDGLLVVYNRIYKNIFDQKWL
ncbi:MAG: AAA-like domain-containing protein, partial [Flavobacteriales bacterium]|nr:AAA-like domain-containing protein [Flavobacteriales bacterium]